MSRNYPCIREMCQMNSVLYDVRIFRRVGEFKSHKNFLFAFVWIDFRYVVWCHVAHVAFASATDGTLRQQFQVFSGVPGDSDSIHLTTSPPPEGSKKTFSTPFFFSLTTWVTIVRRRKTLTSRQTTLHHITPLVRHIIPGNNVLPQWCAAWL